MTTGFKSRKGPRPLADLARQPLSEAMKQAGFAATEVVTRWEEIVGPELSRHSAPIKLAWQRRRDGIDAPEPGTLHVQVSAPFALEIQYLQPVILERVNAFFGWRCAAGMRITRVPMVAKAKPRGPKRLPADEERLRMVTEGITDAKLKTALERLGRAVGKDPGGT